MTKLDLRGPVTFDFSPYEQRFKYPPFQHQYIGIETLIRQPQFFLADEMGAGKTLQVICAAQILYEQKQIDRVVVVTPASIRSVWFDPELGELAKHLFIPSLVSEYHTRIKRWGDETGLRWVVTNYEFIRDPGPESTKRKFMPGLRLKYLMRYCNEKTMLVLDESSAVKSHKSAQTKSCLLLRKRCGRVVLLNGTPIANSPEDLYSQADILDGNRRRAGILGVDNYYHFRARYAIMGGWMLKQIVEWRDLDHLQQRLAPYVLRRLKKDCLDLPKKLEPVVLTATLTEATWKSYVSMRDDFVTWLSKETASLAPHSLTKVMRLAQITSGFIGGVEELLLDEVEDENDLQTILEEKTEKSVQTIGQEKLNVFLELLDECLAEDPNIKILVFSRFRPEVLRVLQTLGSMKQYEHLELGALIGRQKAADRKHAIRLLDPRTAPKGPAVVAAILGAGAKGLNLTASHTVIRLSNDYSLEKRLQSDDRVHRPPQTFPVSYFDIVAAGPKGQKTIDHGILVRLLKKETTSRTVTGGWVTDPREWIDILTAE